eukprot:COSAG01_NODE_2870_length_6943_cov_18.189801_3_plen_143_part_00
MVESGHHFCHFEKNDDLKNEDLYDIRVLWPQWQRERVACGTTALTGGCWLSEKPLFGHVCTGTAAPRACSLAPPRTLVAVLLTHPTVRPPPSVLCGWERRRGSVLENECPVRPVMPPPPLPFLPRAPVPLRLLRPTTSAVYR